MAIVGMDGVSGTDVKTNVDGGWSGMRDVVDKRVDGSQ